MKKICPLCETENEEDARFCKDCNEPLYLKECPKNNSNNKDSMEEQPFELISDEEAFKITKKGESKGFFNRIFSNKTPLYNNFQEISNAALDAITANRNNNDIINILKQGLNFIDKATAADIERMNTIASLLARPRFREMEAAVKFWERIVELDPLNFNALSCLISFYIPEGQNNNAYQIGKLLLKSDYRASIVKEKEIVQLMGPSAEEFDVQNLEKPASTLYSLLGNFYIEQSDYPLAITAFNIALEIDPNNMDALNNIAVVFFRIKEYPEALRYYRRCLEVTPIEMQKEYREALEKHNLNPSSVIKGVQAKEKIKQMIRKAESEILFNIGECLFMLNKTDDARDVLRESAEKSSEFPHRDLTEVVEEILAELWKKYK